jgi:hypothetical protein
MTQGDFQQLQWIQNNQLRLQQQEQARQSQQLQQRMSQQQTVWNQQRAKAKRRQKSATPLRGAGWLPETGDNAEPLPAGAPRAEAGRIVGVARAVNQRFEQSVVHRQNQLTVWTFRVERHDEEGRALSPVPVEIRGLNFKGNISEGDWVDVGRSWRPGSVLRPKRVHNLTTGDRLRVSGRGPRAFGFVIGIVLFAAWCTFAALLVLGKLP